MDEQNTETVESQALACLDFLGETEGAIEHLTLGNGTRYRVSWPNIGEAQADWFPSVLEAVNAARQKE